MKKFIEQKRVFVLVAITLSLLTLFILRVFYLQIFQGGKFLNESDSISTSRKILEPRRGFIYDRKGEPLVFHEEFFVVKMNPTDIDSLVEMTQLKERLAEQLDLSIKYLDRKLIYDANSKNKTPIVIKENVSFLEIAYLAENKDAFPGVYWEAQSRRIYSEEAGIAHILGYVAEISESELQVLYNDGYRKGDKIGKSGIEREYDKFLRGTIGYQYFLVDALGRQVKELEEERQLPQNGSSVYLTIDMRLQRLAYDALAGRRGSVIVLKPATGEILAMVSNPVFNANTFSESGDGSLSKQITDPNFPFINRAISAVYPAASTFKIVSYAAIREHNIVSPDFRVYCPGYMYVGNSIFYCHNKSGHGWQNLSDALANSCNVYFWTIAKDYLGKDSKGNADPSTIATTARDFGLGSYTEIDLPGEKSGLVPDKDWKEDTFNSVWVGGDTMNMVIGQGFVQSTPLQMANATAMVANQGFVYKPYVVMRIINEEIGLDDTYVPQILHESQISTSTWRYLGEDMRQTVTRGTGWVLTKTVPVAGKTGTGETGVERQYHDWFVAYAPYQPRNQEDQIVVAVQIEANDNYQWWSSKVADFIIQGYFAHQDYHDVLRTLKPWYMNWRAITGDIIYIPPQFNEASSSINNQSSSEIEVAE